MRAMEEILRDAQALFDFLSHTQTPLEPAELVLAMGSQDLGVANVAAQAFFQRSARWLVCSGGFGKDTAALFHRPEGVLYAERCQALGVPAECILVEDRAANSGENFQFSKALLERRGIAPRTGVIACKPYMAKRALATGAMQWPEVRWGAVCVQTGLDGYLAQGNELDTVLNLMVGDLQRLRVYAGRFQAAVEVPDEIWAAFQRLAGDGYDRYVIREI